MESTLFSGATPLLLFVAKATFLLIAALLATSTLRRSTAGARHLVWLAALVGVLALPVLARIPALQIGVLPSGLNQTPTVVGASRERRSIASPSSKHSRLPGPPSPPACSAG